MLAPLVFAQQVRDPDALGKALLAFVAFFQLMYYRQIDLNTLASAMSPEQLDQLRYL